MQQPSDDGQENSQQYQTSMAPSMKSLIDSLFVPEGYTLNVSRLSALLENNLWKHSSKARDGAPFRDFICRDPDEEDRKLTSKAVAVRVINEDPLSSMKEGFSPDLLRQLCLLSSITNSSFRPKQVYLHSTCVGILWNCSSILRRDLLPLPEADECDDSQRNQQRSMWVRVWLYQLLMIFETFHSIGRVYHNVLSADALFYGINPVFQSFIAKLDVDTDIVDWFCTKGYKLLQIGCSGQVPYWNRECCPPELFLGIKRRTPAMDMWAFGTLLHELSGNGIAFHSPTAQYSDFGQLMQIFERLGTPVDRPDSWPKVSKLPHYSSRLPMWPPPEEGERLTDKIVGDAQLIDLIKKLLVLDPKRRLTASQTQRHPYFWPLRKHLFLLSRRVRLSPANHLDLLEHLTLQMRKHTKPSVAAEMEQLELSTSMRSILIDWIVDVVEEFAFSDDCLFLSVALIDQVLAKLQVQKRLFQLVGEACFLIVVKLLGRGKVSLDELAYISDGTYSPDDVQRMELIVLQCVELQPTSSTPLHFLHVYMAMLDAPPHQESLAHYLLELSLVFSPPQRFASDLLALSAAVVSSTRMAVQGWHSVPVCLRPVIRGREELAQLTSCCTYMLDLWLRDVTIGSVACNSVDQPVPSLSGCVCVPKPLLEFTEAKLQSMDPLRCLPQVTVRGLLGFLDVAELSRLACVSRHWHQSVFDATLWCSIDLSGLTLRPSLTRLFQRCPLLQTLNLSDGRFTWHNLCILLCLCSRLHTLTLNFISGLRKTSSMPELPISKNIRHLSLRDAEELSLYTAVKVVGALPNLQHLNLSGIKTHSLEVEVLFRRRSCKRPLMRELLLNSCHWLTDSLVHEITRRCPCLTLLQMNGCGNALNNVESIAHNCPELRELGLGLNNVSEASVHSIVAHCVHLTKLNLSFHYELSANATRALSELKDLKSLNLCRVSLLDDESVIALAMNCSRLEVLNLRMCTLITDRAVAALIEHCPNLRILNLFHCSDAHVKVLRKRCCIVVRPSS